ncbi:DnaD domain protein [Liquorilactobacillus nagelii]|uniref:DnaD domain protein n=1 Tax=Liquorilactobacillus nagelii TaxID=82688 RepID=UPI00071111F7|nr:DnaD domain protein [Liquorilactobacillus nagelii]QYH53526.1 chromosome replication initiation protein [Liquorilactobacillus nagelii DSM 13675]
MSNQSVISPTNNFVVTTQERLFSSDLEIVLWLYQPMLGAKTVAVYNLLHSFAQAAIEKRQIKSLLEQLAIGLPNFIDARIQLEALGLLRTFQKQAAFDNSLTFLIQRPVQPEIFFKDDLLRSLLLETVGEPSYRRLHHYFFKPAPNSITIGNEISKTFLEVYQVNQAELTNAQLNNLATVDEPAAEPVIKGCSLDFDLLKSLLQNSFLDTNQVWQHQRFLATANVVYGLDEITLIKMLESAADVQTNQVDFKMFAQLLHQTTHSKSNQPSSTVIDSKTSAANNKTVIANSGDQALLAACQAYAPLEFLQTLKDEEGSFVTNSEQHLIENFVQLNYFSPDVVNVLIHYMIVDRGMTSLNRTFFEKVAADWKKKKISSAIQAIQQVRQVNRPLKTRTTTSRRYPTKKVVQKEQLPDWAQSNFKPAKQPNYSAEEQQKLQQKLHDLTHKKS